VITADIKFGNGAIHHCVGRVRNREVVPWTDKADLRAHITHINDRNPDAGVEIVKVFDPPRKSA
jgi:hypothetical protein